MERLKGETNDRVIEMNHANLLKGELSGYILIYAAPTLEKAKEAAKQFDEEIRKAAERAQEPF